MRLFLGPRVLQTNPTNEIQSSHHDVQVGQCSSHRTFAFAFALAFPFAFPGLFSLSKVSLPESLVCISINCSIMVSELNSYGTGGDHTFAFFFTT